MAQEFFWKPKPRANCRAARWKPQPRAKPDGRGEGNEAQAAHQEDTPVDNRQPVVLSYCPSN